MKRKIVSICLVVSLMLLALALPTLADTDGSAAYSVIDDFELLDEDVYTPATYRLANMAYDELQALLEDPDATPDEINDAVEALSQAIAALRIKNGSDSLAATYLDYFELGTIYTNRSSLDQDTIRGQLSTQHFNALTAENHMKPSELSSGGGGTEGVFNIYEGSDHIADQMCREAQEYGMTIHGHVLVWHSQSPAWLNTGAGGSWWSRPPLPRAEAKENMELYIKTVLTHFDTYYPGVVSTWDVVNEAFQDGVDTIPDDADWKNYLRTSSAWYRAYNTDLAEGEHASDFIYDAFVFARKYTDAKLFYNDFNMYQDGKSKLVAQMTIELNERYRNEYPDDPRKLIEGVGMQSHNYIMDTPASSVENGILNLLAADVDLIISELDLFCWFPWNAEPTSNYIDLRDRGIDDIIGSQGTPEQRNYWIDRGVTNGSQIEVVQAERFAEYFQVYKDYYYHIDRVTFWGLNDAQNWRSGHNPLLWNSDWSAKDAFYAVSDPEGYLGVDPYYVLPMPAPKVAEIILAYNDLEARYGSGRTGGNVISEVATAMGPKQYYQDLASSIMVNDMQLSNPAYREAVYEYLVTHPGMAGNTIIMPPNTYFIANQ